MDYDPDFNIIICRDRLEGYNVKLEYFVGFSVALTMFLFIFQLSATNVASEMGEDGINFFNYEDSHIKDFDGGNYTLNGDYLDGLPDSNAEVEDDGGNVFTDTFKIVRDWVAKTTGIKYIVGVLNALPNFLKQLFGTEYAGVGFALGYLWHILSFIAFIIWLKG